MRQGNKNIRDKAIPFDPVLVSRSYMYDPENSTPLTKTGLMTRPEKADVVAAYLFMEMTAPSDRSLEVRIGIGQWVEAAGVPTLVPVETYSEEYIESQHRKLSGRDTPFSVAANGTLIIDANLLPGLPKAGDSNFLSDMFVLLVTFNSGISTANGYALNKFKVTCSGQMGLGT